MKCSQSCNIWSTREAPQLVSLASGISLPVSKSACEELEKWYLHDAMAYSEFARWWKQKVIYTYDPRQRHADFAFSIDYNRMWNYDGARSRQLLFTIITNALLDAVCISRMMYVQHFENLCLVYAGCAHAEIVNFYFSTVHASKPVEALQNADRLTTSVTKIIDFPHGTFKKMIQRKSSVRPS